MTRQIVPLGARLEPHEAIPRAAPAVTRRRVPDAGDHLRRAVDSVLAGLAASTLPDPQALHRFDDTLRGALAWTAAVGDTCRITGAVRAVRDARCRLNAKDLDRARVALLSARDGLRLPGSRKPID